MISSVGDFNDKLSWGWITVAGDIESVKGRGPAEGERKNFAGDDLLVATC